MSKSTNKSKPAVMLIETSPQAKILMLKRGRLFVRGANIPVRPLSCPDKSQAWVNVSLEKTDSNPWDTAHELAGRMKTELGQSVFVEPDTGDQSRFASLHIPRRQRNSTKTAMNALLGRKGKGGNSPGPYFGPSANMRPGSLSRGGFGNPSAISGMSGLPGMAGLMPSIPDPLADVLPQGVMEALSGQDQMSAFGGDDEDYETTLVLVALQALPGWSDLEKTRKQMFEAEAKQLHSYIKSQPASASELPASLIDGLIATPSISKSLKSYLAKAIAKRTESGSSTENA